MDTYREILPATASAPKAFVEFTPLGGIGQGRLAIEQNHTLSEYRIARFAAEGGHAFHFEKLSQGSDRSEAAYDVFVTDRRGLFDSCDCKGFQRHGHCKHTAAIRAVLENQWL